MFEIIKSFFDKHILIEQNNETEGKSLLIASAALLIEMMHAEEIELSKKRAIIVQLFKERDQLSADKIDELFDIAEQKRKSATDYFEFTHLIADAYSREQKIRLIEVMWDIALIDQHLDFEEEYVIDKLSRLLYVPHSDVLQAKIRARNK
jgi:uncharacterized tellurite resistance protein B-like protein